MAVGRISGPLLKDNLLRNGVNLAFETSLLYLDVNNSRVGINTATPTNDLSVNGTTRTTNLYISGSSTLGSITVSGSTISSSSNTITFTPSGGSPSVNMTTANIGDLSLSGNTISSVNTNEAINITANGTGVINLNNNVLVTGNLHATGTITADGNITLGAATNDTITFTGEVNSNILPATTNTYTLGSNSLQWNNVYTQGLTTNTFSATTLNTTTFNTASLQISGTTITPTTPNTSIYFNSTGSGGIVFGNLQFTNNTITNVASNAVTQFTQTTNNASFTATIAPGSPIAISGSISGSTLSLNASPFWGAGGSITFAGSNQYISMSPGITVGNGAFTVEGFFYMTAGTSGFIFGGSSNYGLGLQINSLTSISVSTFNVSSNTYTVPTISLNTWYHVAVTRNSSGVETVFFNGTRSSTGTTSTNLNYLGLTSLIGEQGNTGYFAGRLTNLRIVVGSNVYDPTQTTITVPTGALTAVTNTKLLLNALTPSAYITDTSGPSNYQTLTANGPTFSITTPYATGTPTLVAGMALSGSSVLAGTYVVSNISGTGTSSSSSWYVSLSYSSPISYETMTATPIIMTVSAVASGTILPGMTITGTGLSANSGIVANFSGTGGTGTYYVAPSQTVSTPTSISGTIQGYVQFIGTNGIAIPVGNNSNYPSTLYETTGMLRFNTQQQYVEVYNGSAWGSVAGSSSGVTTSTANSIGAGLALALG
jgi:trimeric autotransporter adhesin